MSKYFSHLQPATPVAALPEPTVAPTIDPTNFVEVDGTSERFFGAALQHLEDAERLFDQARYQGAIKQFTKAQQAHGEPSAVLQSWIGNAYRALGKYQEAIRHFTNAIEIEDNPTVRINRAWSYRETNRCDLAINNAHAVLAMEHESVPGFHTDAEAHAVLALCHAAQSVHANTLKHLQDYASIAKDNQYPPEEIATIYTKAARWAYNDEAFTYAIEATSGAIQIHDSAVPRASRALSYARNQNCPLAVEDAKQALAFLPYQEPGFHTDVTANYVLAWCYSEAQHHIAALQHAEAALSIARLHEHPPNHIQIYSDMVQHVRDGLSP